MSTARKLHLIDVDDYLAGELLSQVKHEYVNGVVYAMAEASTQHNRIATNIIVALGTRLRRKPCQPFNSDTKIRVRTSKQTRFYYPDVSVVCKPNAAGESYQDQPVVVFEVLSQSTRRVDLSEKKEAYLSIPSMLVYAVVDQNSSTVILYRRSGDSWTQQVYERMTDTICLKEIDTELPLAEIYEGVEFMPEPEEQELE